MFDWLFDLTALTVFLTVAGFGFLFLLVSLIFGEIFDFFDGDLDHDFDHGGPGFFSSRVMGVFITTFGGAGAIATYYGLSTVASSLAGLVSGVALASVVYAFARFLYGQQASTDVSSKDLVGRTGRVVVTIPKNGMGQIRCQVGEQLIDKIARSGDGKSIPENHSVKIEEVLGELVVVRPL